MEKRDELTDKTKILEASFTENVDFVLKLIMVPNGRSSYKELANSAEQIKRGFEKLVEINELPAIFISEDPTPPHGFPEGSHVVATYELTGKRDTINLIRVDRLLSSFFEAFPCFNYQIQPKYSHFVS